MGQEIIPFKQFINKRMTRFKFFSSLFVSIILTICATKIIFVQYTETSKTFIEAIAPHVSTLMETQDRAEIQRFIKSVSEKQDFEIEVIHNDDIIASSVELAKIGKKFNHLKNKIPSFDLYYNNGAISAQTDGNTKLVSYLSLYSVLYPTFVLSILVFIASLFIFNQVIYETTKIVQESLKPLTELEAAIHDSNLSIPRFNITELENIRLAFEEANEKLAKSKAKELTTTAYKNLIHDLRVPVSAIRNHLKIMSLERATESDKEKALLRIVELAEQVLKQVKSACSNLSLEVTLINDDIRECVRKVIGDAQVAAANKPQIEIKEILPDFEILKGHDPILLGRALNNLVANAIESASTLVQVELGRHGDEVSIKVHDDGPGLSQEEASLFLLGRGKSTKADRLGIGLSSANHIIRSHGGKIIHSTSPLGGASFEIRMQGDIV